MACPCCGGGPLSAIACDCGCVDSYVCGLCYTAYFITANGQVVGGHAQQANEKV